MENLVTLKSRLDYQVAAASYVKKYRKLGWDLQAVNPQDGTHLEVNFAASPETWLNRLWEPGLSGPGINLRVRTGRRSGLMVLEVAGGAGASILAPYGPWRAACIATLGAGREQHFYAWDPSARLDPASFRGTPEIRWFGEGQVVPVPPSADPEREESWRWLCPPWEKLPQCPSRSLSGFLQQGFTLEPRPEVSLSWQQVYCLVSPYEPLLQALSASYPLMRNYYQGILEAAAMVGLKAPEVLLSLLWHAPRGHAPQHPECWNYLQKLVTETKSQPGTAASPAHTPWELCLDHALSLAGETSARNPGQTPDKPGPPCFLLRRLAKPPRPGTSARTPFSCRQTTRYLRNIQPDLTVPICRRNAVDSPTAQDLEFGSPGGISHF